MGLVVVLVLIVAPIGSFFFLRNGIQYRIDSLDQLAPKVIDSQLQGVIKLSAPFNGNARLIHIPGEQVNEELQILQRLDEKIVDRERFDIISLMDEPEQFEDHNISFNSSNHFVRFDEQFVLIDTSEIVRGVYPFEKGLEKVLIRHLSVVIPIPKRKSITLQRNKQN